MILGAFLLEVVLVSLSGVMAPGPITTLVVGKGARSPHAGAWVAVGHGLVELPLMVAVFFGAGRLLEAVGVRSVISLVGGVFLLVMSIGLLRSSQGVIEAARDERSPIVGGAVLTAANPYFLIWWATIGVTLAVRSALLGVIGFAAFALVHLLCDFAWCYFLSALSYRGGQFFGQRFQRALFALCGALLLFYGGKLMLDGIRGLQV